ncbi:MAG: hypothetical protein KKE94_14595, partial [Gammaproteobacteria bacterium]|nr:hypothetical protein [Gammaproteobacteria bacterium]
MEIGSYIETLTTFSEPQVLNEMLTYVKPDEIQLYRQAFGRVTQLLKTFIQNDAAKTEFTAEYLDRVVRAFSNDTTEQIKQRQVLEAILRYGVREHKFSAAQIPQIYSAQRDLPTIGPLGLLHANPAFELYTLITNDLQYPKKLKQMQLEIGRLVAVLYLFESVQSLKDAAVMIRRYQLNYAGGAVFLIAPDDDEFEQTRYVVQPYTAVLLQLLRQYEHLDKCLEKVAISSNKALGYVSKYLAYISQSDAGKVTLSLLKDYRKLYWTYYLGPVQANIILQRFKTTLLPTNIFVRTISDKCLKITAVQMPSFNRSAFERAHVAIKNSPDRDRMVYQSVKQTEKLIRELLSFIKTPAKWSKDKNVEQSDKQIAASSFRKSRQKIINLLLKRIQQAEAQDNFYVLLFGYYMVDLLRNGGVSKKVLSYRTIHDYVSAPLRAFLLVINDFDMCKMDEEELTDKLNTVAQTMPATISNRLYYLALFIEKLELVDGFSASNIEVSTQTGKVNANVISVPQMERLLEYLHSLGEQYVDAIILLCLGFYAGCRRGEAQFIRVSDFEIVNSSAGTQILCKIVPIYQRKLKSTAGTRSILLNVFWPQRWLMLLEQKLRFAVSSGVTRSDLLFDDSVVTTFGTISDLLRRYLADEGFVFHNLRHSFVCWQFFRLILAPDLLQQTGLKCFEDEYFSVQSCQALKKRLGVLNITRRLVFTLRGLVGHDTPNITFSSYFHLRDVFTYLLLSTHLPLTQKALSCLVKGAKLDEMHLKEFPAEAVRFNNSFL